MALVVRSLFCRMRRLLRLDGRTKRVRRGILEATFDEPIAPGSSKFFRDFPLSRMGADAVEVLRDRKLAFPEGANNRVKAIRAVFKWAVRKKGPDGKSLASHNAGRDVPYLKSNNPSGYHTWTAEEVRQFEARHPIGTKARLALALLLFTGQRRSDITRLGRQHARDGKITFTQFKGRNHKPKRLVLPILPALQQVIDASPCGDLAFLVNDLGRPFTDPGFGNKFREWCTKQRFAKHGAWLAQSRCDHRSKQWCHGASAHGDLRLGHAQNGGSLHTFRRSTALGRGRNAPA